jgi:hypothetical protein
LLDTCTVKFEVETVVGVPEIVVVEFALEVARTRPTGREPEETLHA